MKFMNYSAVLALVAFSLSLGAFAKDRKEGKFTLSNPASVGSTQLRPGDYKVTWEGSGADVQGQIFQGKHGVETSQAKLVANPTRQDSVTVSGDSGTRTIDQIDFSSGHKSLVFATQPTAQ